MNGNNEFIAQFLDEFFGLEDQAISAVRNLRNRVIGSNRMKTHVLSCGLLSHLLSHLTTDGVSEETQLEVLITLGSLARGTKQHVQYLIDAGTISTLMTGLKSWSVELCAASVRCLRSLLKHSTAQYPAWLRAGDAPESTAPDSKRPPLHELVPLMLQCVRTAAPDSCPSTTENVLGALASLCQCPNSQDTLFNLGVVDLATLHLSSGCAPVQVAALRLISSLCFNNCSVTERVIRLNVADGDDGRALTDLVCQLTERHRPAAVQLEACRCLCCMHRAGTPLLAADDRRVVFVALPTLVALCETASSLASPAPAAAAGGTITEQGAAKEQVRQRQLQVCVSAAETLAYLLEVDVELQRAASITDHLIDVVVGFLSWHPQSTHPFTKTMQQFTCIDMARTAYLVLASLSSNDVDIRRRVAHMPTVLSSVMACLSQTDTPSDSDLLVAALKCLLSLTRSVHTLRTALQDAEVWQPVIQLARRPDIACCVRAAASAVLCNLVLEFSPCRPALVVHDCVDLLVELCRHSHPAVRLNGIWSLMNLAYQADQRVKWQLMQKLSNSDLFRLLSDPAPAILMKTLGLLRNLLSRQHVDQFMDAAHGAQIMQAVVLTLEGDHSAEVKEQALCLLASVANGVRSKEFIMDNEDVLKKITNYMTHSDVRLITAAVLTMVNLVRRGEEGFRERQNKLRRVGALAILQNLQCTSNPVLFDAIKTALIQFN